MSEQEPLIRSNKAVAARLIASRKIFWINQQEFASRAGIPQNTYNQYENAKGRPSLKFALQLYDTYGLTLDWIYLGDMGNLKAKIADEIYANLEEMGERDSAMPRPRVFPDFQLSIAENIK